MQVCKYKIAFLSALSIFALAPAALYAEPTADSAQVGLKSIYDDKSIAKPAAPITPNPPTSQMEARPNIDAQNFPEATEGNPPVNVAQPETEVNAKTENEGKSSVETNGALRITNKSLMFRGENLVRLGKVFEIYVKNYKNRDDNSEIAGEKQDILDDLLAKYNNENGEKAPEIIIKAPLYIYLNSIIYRSSNSGKIWINGEPIEVGEEKDSIAIENISKQAVKLSWKVKDPNINLSKWDAVREKYSASSASEVVVDSDNRAIVFSLSANQYLDVPRMRIIEGKVAAINQGDLGDDSVYYDPAHPETRIVEKKNLVDKVQDGASDIIDSITSP
ncbi:MAG: hypothetical protein COV36_03930 [Alphaproteobacteria bacterium CG11_big_fil_rev_8_21_14_0_20_44_7]|nr:MAG: hypothetical protein COV36_03930 [Alphaproteobacteria bacterium CG11_big_fil_rev_8_21_14_0_20_44_7]